MTKRIDVSRWTGSVWDWATSGTLDGGIQSCTGDLGDTVYDAIEMAILDMDVGDATVIDVDGERYHVTVVADLV